MTALIHPEIEFNTQSRRSNGPYPYPPAPKRVNGQHHGVVAVIQTCLPLAFYRSGPEFRAAQAAALNRSARIIIGRDDSRPSRYRQRAAEAALAAAAE